MSDAEGDGVDLVLVNPGDRDKMYGRLGASFSAIEPPVWTALLAAFIRDRGFSVKILDADAEGWDAEYTWKKIAQLNPVLAGVSAIGANPSASSTPKMPVVRRVLEILKERSPNIKTALYGIHPSALPERTLREERVDFVCRGESFYTVVKLLQALKSGGKTDIYDIRGLWYERDGKVTKGGWGELVKDLDRLPFAAWDLLPMERYRAHNWHCFGRLDKRQPYAVIYTSLGCPFNCAYCNIHALYSGKPGIRFRSPRRVVEEIDYLVKSYGVRNIKILDELFVINDSRVIELCGLLIERRYDLNMWAYARVDTVNEKVLGKMKRAGINWVAYGIESGSKKVRDGVAKGRFGEESIRRAVKMTHDNGIHIVANFIFGLPDDDFDSMRQTLDLAKDLNCEYANFYASMAYPGSKLYEEALRRGTPLPEAWSGYAQLGEDAYPAPAKKLSGADILRFRDEAFREYYSDPRYLDMMEEKFGHETAEHIREMLKFDIRRKLLTGETARSR